MAVKTVRFNKDEERMLKKILAYYQGDFSSCVKELLAEKLEDLRDIRMIQGIKESKSEDYLIARDIDKLF
jgi:hypothetical protein